MPDPEFLPFTRPAIDADTIADVGRVLASGWITSGPKVLAFEAALSALFGGRPVRAFANGTSTMEVALRLAGIGPGDEVITTPVTWVATANVIVAVGARPVFVEVDPRTRNIDLGALEAAITPRTRALMPVYLAGLPVDMDRLYDIAGRHGLRVIEDAAQAIDSRWGGAAHRQLRRPGELQLPGQQEHHLRRRRLPGAERRGRGRAGRAPAPAGRGAHRPGRHGRRTAGRQVQPHRHQRRHRPGPAAPPRRGHAPARGAGAGLLRRRRGGRAAGAGRRTAAGAARRRRHHQLAHVPGAAAGRPAGRRPRRRDAGPARRPASAPACITPRCTCSPTTAGSAGATASCRRPNASAAAS